MPVFVVELPDYRPVFIEAESISQVQTAMLVAKARFDAAEIEYRELRETVRNNCMNNGNWCPETYSTEYNRLISEKPDWIAPYDVKCSINGYLIPKEGWRDVQNTSVLTLDDYVIQQLNESAIAAA